ncbi:MAG: hypothetical protein AAB384_04430 [Patescibacteria group bacterium]
MPTVIAARDVRGNEAGIRVTSPNQWGVIVVTFDKQLSGLKLIFEPDRIISQKEVETWKGVYLPYPLKSGGYLPFMWSIVKDVAPRLRVLRTSVQAPPLRRCYHLDLVVEPTDEITRKWMSRIETGLTCESWKFPRNMRELRLL